MQNLFYVPPHPTQDVHPKPVGVRTVVKRNAPTRLDLSSLHPSTLPGAVQDMGLLTHGDVATEPGLGPVVASLPRTSFKVRLGGWLIHMGQTLQGHSPNPQGQFG